jgi:hypothetical protein
MTDARAGGCYLQPGPPLSHMTRGALALSDLAVTIQ